MQRWWLVVAGIVGIGLAVLLIPRPDTGGEIPSQDLSGIEVPQTRTPQADEGVIRAKRRPDGSRDRTMMGSRDDGSTVRTKEATIDPAPGAVTRINPKASRLDMRRNTPETQYARKTLAPWTQLRRLVAQQGPTEGEGLQLLRELESMNSDVREMMREPWNFDGAEMAQRTESLIERVRDSEFHDAETEKMAAVIETRLGDYRAEADATE